jgi:hypothetical protein
MNKFKNSQGKYYTRQLFWEESIELADSAKSIEPMFTLYSDKEGLINLGKAYVESEDPTGYKVSNEYLDGYRMWTILMQAKWFQTAKKLWDEELDARLSSKGIQKLQEMLENGTPPQKAQAAKYFADKEFRKDKTHSRGRPSKDQIAAEARKEAVISDNLAEDYKRIRLVK